MPVTKDQAHMLASLAIACRPTGAPKWDAPGVVAAIHRHEQVALADVAMAVLRRASRRDAKTPVLAECDWAEKFAPPGPPRNPRPDEARCACGCKGYHSEDVRADNAGWRDRLKADIRPLGDRPGASVGTGVGDALEGAESEGEGL